MENKVKVFKNVKFDKEEKIFIIEKGTVGTYNYMNIVSCKIANENAKFINNKEISVVSKAVKGITSNFDNFPTDIYVEVQIELQNGSELKVIVSDKETSMNTLDFHKDRQEAKNIVKFVKEIIHKYQKENK